MIATLNRETAVFLNALFVLTAPFKRRTFAIGAAYAAIWAAVFLALRAISVEADRYWTVARTFQPNVSPPLLAVFNLALFVGAF